MRHLGTHGHMADFFSDLSATVLRGPSAQARPRLSPGLHRGDQGSPQKSKAGTASLDARAAGWLAAASCARGEAAGRRRIGATIRVQEVAELGRLPVDVGSTVEWQRQQRGCEGLGRGEAEGSRPLLDTCSYTRAAQQRWCGARAAARPKPNELSSLGAPPAAKLEGEDNEAAARARRSSGYVRCLAGRAYRRAAPRNLCAWERGRPRLSRGDDLTVKAFSELTLYISGGGRTRAPRRHH